MKRWLRVGVQIGILGLARVAFGQSPFGPAPETHSPEAPAEEEVGRLRGDELRRRFPNLELRAEPRGAQGSIGLGTNGLYLPVDLEATLDLYPRPWLRIGLVYALGLTFKWNEPDKRLDGFLGQYGEVAVGGRILGQHAEVDEELQLGRSIGGYGVAAPKSWNCGELTRARPFRLPCPRLISFSSKAAL